jgi:hypothetical protein
MIDSHSFICDLLVGKESSLRFGPLIWPTGHDDVPFLASRKPIKSVALMPRCTQVRNLDANQ